MRQQGVHELLRSCSRTVVNSPGRVRAAPKHNSAARRFLPRWLPDFPPATNCPFLSSQLLTVKINVIFTHFLLRYALELRISKDTILYCDTCFTAQVGKKWLNDGKVPGTIYNICNILHSGPCLSPVRYRTLQCVAYRNCHLFLNTAAWDILMFGLS